MTDSLGVVAVDFDGTLTERDTLLPFLVRATSRSRVARALAVEARTPAGGRNAYKERVLGRLLRGDDPERLRRLGRDYAEHLHPRLRPGMVEQLDWHRQHDHELVLVSASLRHYLDPLGERLGFTAVIAVDLETADDGRLSGLLAGPNVRGAEKSFRLGRHLAGREPTELWVYGDSSGDEHLFALATHPVPMTRRARRYTP